MSGSSVKEISLGDGFGDVALKVNGATVEVHADGSIDAHTTGDVDAYTNGSVRVYAAANDTAPRAATPEIGAIERTGEHKGEIFGGLYPTDNKPIWFSVVPKLMDHFAAAAWAKEQGGSLPTRKQGDYLTTLKGKGGAFTEIFARHSDGSISAGYFWLAVHDVNGARSQQFSDGSQTNYLYRHIHLPVLSVRR